MAEKPKTVHLKDYTPPTFLTPKVDLHFDLHETETFVTAQIQFTRNSKSKDSSDQLFLNGEDLELIQLEINGGVVKEGADYQQNEKGLTLNNLPDEFTLTTKVKLLPQDNKAFSGLYKTKTVFCTQMEAQGFRRTTFFQDRPDVLSRYKVTIEADKLKYPVLLSNGNPLSQKEVSDTRHQAVWEDPFPKPCYLFALVAGDLDWIEDSYLTRSNKKVQLNIYVDKGKEDRARFAMDSLKQAMKWDEDTFRLEYDLDIYNIVAVDDFNMGAMENKGLNIFNSKYVLASSDTATDEEYMGIQRVIGHEYFHNWTGNRVTCRDWFQLSLKEGLTVFRDQEFSADMNSRPVKRIEDVSNLRSRQFPEDSGPMAHPVRPKSYISIDNFYTVTVYEKGAEVIRMLYSLLGSDMFKCGVTKYFDLFDGQAVTTDDWINAMESVSGRDLTQFKRWYDQAGTPTLSVKSTYDPEQQVLKLDLAQSTKSPITGDLHKPFHIPFKVGLLSTEGSPLDFSMEASEQSSREAVLELTEDNQSFYLQNVYQKPVLSLNRGFSAPAYLNYEQSDEDLYLLMAHDTDSFNRWESAQILYRQTLMHFYNQNEKGGTAEFPQKLGEVIGDIIERGSEDPALTAALLGLPVNQFMAQFIPDLDPQTLNQAYSHFYREMSKCVHERAIAVYQNLQAKNLGQSSKDVALRSFKNSLLGYLYRDDEAAGTSVFYQQFETARNMTDSLSALARLSLNGGDAYEKAISQFRNRWKDDALVMNKLFIVRATAKNEKAFEKIVEETQSSDFDKTNPNNIYALIYTFAQHNWAQFHRSSGETYSWLAEKTLDVDSRNPQVASRLGSCFNQWKKMAPAYRQPMQQSLEKIRESKVSDNLYEIVSKSLA